ncbi:MAG: hypothetical protein ACFBSD_09590 [Paracoccaceae bacterium]
MRRETERDEWLIDPSGRPLERTGFEALFALAIVVVWIVVMAAVFFMMRQDMRGAGAWPSISLTSLGFLCWFSADVVAGRWRLIWPGSALGILGPLSLGFAAALSTPELRTGPFETRLAIVSVVAGVGMIPFLFRYRLPGLVSPIITFSLVGVFLTLYGTDRQRMMELEGFSPRGIVAALMSEPWAMALFAAGGLAAAVYARMLDLVGDNFELAVARPLHLVGGGITALVVGRMLGFLPGPADLIALSLLWILAWIWALRVNRIAVLFATQFAMVKPLVLSVTDPLGVRLSIGDWTILLSAVLVLQFVTWPRLHALSRRLDWTRGPGGRRPPLERPEGWNGFWWRYWPYALEKKDPPAPAGTAAEGVGRPG